MNKLEEIIAFKRKEVARAKEFVPMRKLEASIYFDTQPLSLKHYLRRPNSSGIIAEFKRFSPSKGMLNEDATVEETTIGYMQAGAAALSVLTDTNFFKGSLEDLKTVRDYNFCPILRKDFTVDEYQIIEAKSYGADVILLIAAVLEKDEIKRFTNHAHELGLEVLLELHGADELDKIDDSVDIIGVNNRDLQTMQINTATSESLFHQLPENALRISESGIDSPSVVNHLRTIGYEGFLIGTQFMHYASPKRACLDFIAEINPVKTAHHVC